MKQGAPLKRNPETLRAFQQRGRKSSARALRVSAQAYAATPKASRRQAISPASPAQREAVNGRACVSCGTTASEYVAVDPAHVFPRGRGGCEDPLCVVPLCRNLFNGGCHAAYDEGRLDLLAVFVTGWERWREHFAHALTHSMPVELLERMANARIQWGPTRGER